MIIPTVGRRARAIAARAAALCLAPLALPAQDTPASTQAKHDVLWTRMADSVRALARSTDAVVGVAILDLSDSSRALYLNADALYPTASTIKIALLAELYRQDARNAGARLADPYTVDAKDAVGGAGIMGGLTPGVTRLTNRDLARLTAALSDNSATNVLIARVGMENVNTLLTTLGLQHTRLRRRMMDTQAAREGRENTATPRELVTLLAALHAGKVLARPAADSFFAMLSTPKSSAIPRLLPPDLTIANKPGDLDGVRNDAGIVFVPGRPFAVAVMTTFSGDDRAAEDRIAQIARAAWSYFDRVASSSALGRRR